MNRSNGGTDLKEPVSVARHITDIFNFLSSTDISDALDRLGIQGQPIGILPLWQGCPKVAGPAATLKLTTNPGSSTAIGTLEAMEVANRGDIMVVDNDGRIDVNSWGSMASFCAQYYGLAGCVIEMWMRYVLSIFLCLSRESSSPLFEIAFM